MPKIIHFIWSRARDIPASGTVPYSLRYCVPAFAHQYHIILIHGLQAVLAPLLRGYVYGWPYHTKPLF
jgi:hypothetical protein